MKNNDRKQLILQLYQLLQWERHDADFERQIKSFRSNYNNWLNCGIEMAPEAKPFHDFPKFVRKTQEQWFWGFRCNKSFSVLFQIYLIIKFSRKVNAFVLQQKGKCFCFTAERQMLLFNNRKANAFVQQQKVKCVYFSCCRGSDFWNKK